MRLLLISFEFVIDSSVFLKELGSSIKVKRLASLSSLHSALLSSHFICIYSLAEMDLEVMEQLSIILSH